MHIHHHPWRIMATTAATPHDVMTMTVGVGSPWIGALLNGMIDVMDAILGTTEGAGTQVASPEIATITADGGSCYSVLQLHSKHSC